ncbi:MAG TPA: DUF4097 family beta strand repeat-containing protein [Gemmatimonadales bacterium]|nr:DUF4097 family beta strand repeat-containing protein [Gemmatimonadales bacterium]
MLLLTTLALLSASPGAADTDTIVSVSRGTRLRVETMAGDIVVRAWDRDQVRIQATHSRRTSVEVRQSGSVLSLEATTGFGPGGAVDYELTVPAWMALKLGGMSADITIEGVRAPIEAEVMEGDITVTGGAETVKLGALNGKIRVSGVRGRLEVSGASDDIIVTDLQGDLFAEAISGDLLLRDIRARSVRAASVSGDIWFEGRIEDGGNYSLATHSGDIMIAVAEGTNSTIAARVYSGDTRASFALPAAEQSSRRQQRYRLGNGSAVVDLETFSGDVRLLRPTELTPRIDGMLRDRPDRDRER